MTNVDNQNEVTMKYSCLKSIMQIPEDSLLGSTTACIFSVLYETLGTPTPITTNG
jgi:hypothetical protein